MFCYRHHPEYVYRWAINWPPCAATTLEKLWPAAICGSWYKMKLKRRSYLPQLSRYRKRAVKKRSLFTTTTKHWLGGVTRFFYFGGKQIFQFFEAKNSALPCRLRACLALQSFFRDLVRNLRDSLGTAPTAPHSLNHSVSSLDAPTTNRSKIGKRTKFAATGSVVSGSGKL